METTMSSVGKLVTLAAIAVVFAIAAWRLGAPQSFQTALADAGIGAKPVVAAPAPAPAPAVSAPATSEAPPAAQTAPAQPQSDSSAGH